MDLTRLTAAVAVLITAVLITTVHVGHASGQDEPVALEGHTAAVTTVAWADDGKTLATASDDRSIRVWDPSTGRQTASLADVARPGYGGPVVAMTPNLGAAAVNYWGSVTIRTIPDGETLASIDPIPEVPGRKSAFRADVIAMAISPDGKRLATAGSVAVIGGRHGLPGGVVIVWDVESGRLVHQSKTLSTAASAVVWSGDGKRYAAGTNGAGGELPEPGEVRVWDAESGKVLHKFPVQSEVDYGEWASAGDVAFSPDGRRVAVPVTAGSRGNPAGILIGDTGASVRIWDLEEGTSERAVKGLAARVGRVVFSPNGKMIATAGSDKVLRLWDLATGKELASLSCPDRITAVAFRPDGKFLAGGCKDGTLRVWRTPAAP